MWNYRKFGTAALLIQLLAIGVYCALVIHERIDPYWSVDKSLSHANKTLLGVSIHIVESSVVVACLGKFVDSKRTLAIIALALLIPIVILMGGFRGSRDSGKVDRSQPAFSQPRRWSTRADYDHGKRAYPGAKAGFGARSLKASSMKAWRT
jgi:hypothetical protein